MKLFIGNFKGPKGDSGSKGDKGNKGDKGEPGQRGSRWLSGTAITGTKTTGTIFASSGITALQYDYYVNTSTGNLYECTVAGEPSVAEWVYIGSFKGPKGDTGPEGSISNIDAQKPTYTEEAELENIQSGETVKIAFGKIKKAISVLIAHYAQKATVSILGHVKLSSSTAITNAGEFALDAIEKNASIEGTLAHQIAQTNGNLSDYICDSGIIKGISVPIGTNGTSVTVNFTRTLNVAPIVFCQPTQLGAYMGLGVTVRTSDFVVTIINNYSSPLVIDIAWVAVYHKS